MEASRPLTLRVRTSACVFLVFGHLGTTKVSLTNDECKKLIVEMTTFRQIEALFQGQRLFARRRFASAQKTRTIIRLCE